MNTAVRAFLVDDESVIGPLSRVLQQEGYLVQKTLPDDGDAVLSRTDPPAVALLDICCPGRHKIDILQKIIMQEIPCRIVILSAEDSAERAIEALKEGSPDRPAPPFNAHEVRIVLQNVSGRMVPRARADEHRHADAACILGEIIGTSPALKELKTKIAKLARAAVSTVLITGESGTGKELFARYVHRMLHEASRKSCAPFVKVNCAALPETLLESELFGYEKGSFTDAKSDKKGLFELAQGGSILLDEIGDMKRGLQAKLLRVLEERTIRPVGGSEEIPIDVTVIATTNRNLAEAVEQGSFRMDLFFRLNTFYLHIPPLRERKEDIPAIIRHFLSTFVSRYKRPSSIRISPESEKILLSHNWPGNIRELRNLLERLVVLEGEEEIRPERLPNWLTSETGVAAPTSNGRLTLPPQGLSLDDLEKDLIRQALERTNYNKTRAAKLLGLSYDAFRYQVKKFGTSGDAGSCEM